MHLNISGICVVSAGLVLKCETLDSYSGSLISSFKLCTLRLCCNITDPAIVFMWNECDAAQKILSTLYPYNKCSIIFINSK